ncbi:hypothetical protein RJ639_006018 [Escallonia herrerae]|uniref:RNase H type-1 domain-containing protein n=1 Tax=Escallonia herrerae TaxID=1293975 RepID=A0AA88VYP8_9ASTE|nr:hypothetical protein RJ639_006018 [Escallonia herrerae]
MVSTYHLMMKLPTEYGIGEVKRDQTTARQCYVTSCRSKNKEALNLYVDGSSALGGSGAGIILISPEGFVVEYALCFGFQASNNEAEYQAILAGIRLAHALKKFHYQYIVILN